MDNFADSEADSRRSGLILFWLTAAFAFFWFLGREALSDEEALFGVIVRNLLAGHFFDAPTVNGVIEREVTTPAIWFVGLPSLLAGGVGECWLRVSSALAALAALAGTLYLGRKLYGERAARTAGWLLLGSFGLLFWGRLGTPDMAVLATTVWAAAYLIGHPQREFRHYLVFWLIAFSGAWLKGLPAALLPLAISLPFLRRGSGPWWSLPAAFLAALLAGLLYFSLPFIWEFHDSTAGVPEMLGRACFAEFNIHYRQSPPPPRFFLEFLRMGFPWLLFNFAALVGLIVNWRKLNRNTADLAVGFVFAAGLLFVCGARKWDALLPLLAFVQLLTAASLVNEGHGERYRPIVAFMRLLVTIVASVAIISIFLLPFWQRLFKFSPPALFLIGLPLFGLIAIAVMAFDENRRDLLVRWSGLCGNLAAVLIAGTVLAVGVFAWLIPSWEELLPARPFLLSAPARLRHVPERNYVFFGRAPSARVIYYLHPDWIVPTVADSAELRKFALQRPGEPLAIFVSNRPGDAPAVPATLARLGLPVADEPDFRESYWKFERKNNRKLQIWVIDPAKRKGSN
jgi:4-amino-4-deoxy-L-arabinose transferase-like glycosyltransferase